MNAAAIQKLVDSGETITEDQVESMIYDSDPANHKTFFTGLSDSHGAVTAISNSFVKKYLNNPDQSAVPIRRKTKFLLVLNNIALDRKYRGDILSTLHDMDNIFEESMKREGTMPFDSELGRMSEHVLVLLMRVTNYKFKAAQTLEFAEGNTQFAVQLLLAILLKEPAYELELRVNCISGLLGFTQPHTFFNPEEKIEETGCGKFSEKVDFILNLMLRLSAVQVVNDVLTPHILNCTGAVTPMLHVAATHMMRCCMNIFHFAGSGATKWRQHILVSTSFVDGASILYLQAQIRHLDSLFTNGELTSSVNPELLSGIAVALKFLSFATFHMGKYGRCMRPLCHFLNELAEIKGLARLLQNGAPSQSGATHVVVNWLHFISNIDALAGDDEIVAEEGEDALPTELTSKELKQAVTNVLSSIRATGSLASDTIAKRFTTVSPDSLVSTDTTTFSIVSGLMTAAAPSNATSGSSASSSAAPPTSEKKAAVATTAEPAKTSQPKVSAEEAQNVQVEHNFGNITTAPSQTGANRFLCALNGHTMKNPVVSPHGYTFEKDVIEQWLRQKGNVCPFTGKPLSTSDLKPNKELQNEIMQQVVLQTMQSASYEDDGDMYDF